MFELFKKNKNKPSLNTFGQDLIKGG